MKKPESGFTLIEVLLALAVIAIALTALLTSTAQNISNTSRMKERTISHWIAMQGAAMAQLGLLPPTTAQEITQTTTMFGQRWYWRVNTAPTLVKNMFKITITVSKKQTGPFADPLVSFRHVKNG